MKKENIPNPNLIFPIKNLDSITYVKPSVKNPNIIVGEFTYFADKDFEKHVTHHYDFIGDKLIIGKFCQIAAGVEFIMNGANHQMNAVSTYPFYIFGTWEQSAPDKKDLPLKGDTIIGNDVWIGQNVTILPGVHIGDGVIIGANSVVGNNVEPYTIIAGNPAKKIFFFIFSIDIFFIWIYINKCQGARGPPEEELKHGNKKHHITVSN